MREGQVVIQLRIRGLITAERDGYFLDMVVLLPHHVVWSRPSAIRVWCLFSVQHCPPGGLQYALAVVI